MLEFYNAKSEKSRSKVVYFEKYPQILKENVKHWHGIEAGRESMPVQRKTPIHSLLNFLFFKSFTSAIVFNIESPNFRYSLTLTWSFHF